MTTTSYWIGSTLVVDWALRSPAGAVVDDATVTGTVAQPGGTSAAMSVAWASADEVYRATFTPTLAGRHEWRLSASGTATGAVMGTTFVQPSDVGLPVTDRLATPGDLGAVLGLGAALDHTRAGVLIEIATAVVQAACGQPPQRLILVEDDEVDLLGDLGSWLDLPQRPVQSITSVSIDDGDDLTAGTDYKRFGSRLWRAAGWQAERYVPSTVHVVYSHGYPAGDQGLQLARAAVLGLIRGVYGNPGGATAVRVDDYSASYDKLAAQMDASPHLQRALVRQYGRPAGLVRLG